MPDVVTIDRAGRIVIPKDTRAAQRIRPGTKFLLVEGRDGRIWLQRLDAAEIARHLHDELEGVDLDPIIAKVRAEISKIAAEKYLGPAKRKR